MKNILTVILLIFTLSASAFAADWKIVSTSAAALTPEECALSGPDHFWLHITLRNDSKVIQHIRGMPGWFMVEAFIRRQSGDWERQNIGVCQKMEWIAVQPGEEIKLKRGQSAADAGLPMMLTFSGALSPGDHPGSIILLDQFTVPAPPNGIPVAGDSTVRSELTVTIDASKAKVPDGYPFTIAQVADAVSACLKLMQPARPENELKFSVRIIPAATAAAAPGGGHDPRVKPLPPREPAAALAEFKAEVAAIKKWSQELNNNRRTNPFGGFTAIGKIAAKVSAIRLDGLPEDLSAEFTKFMEVTTALATLGKEFPDGTDTAKAAEWFASHPDWPARLTAIGDRMHGSTEKLKEIGKKYGMEGLFDTE